MADGRDGENVIHIIGGDVADNQGGKLNFATGYENQEASVDATFNLINDEVAMKRLIPIEDVFLKTKMCEGFSSGTCQNGTNCKFAHGIEDLRTPEQNCEEFEVAQQNRALLAKLKEQFHIQPVESSGLVMETERSKGRHCKRFHSDVGCPFGDKCTYIHDEELKSRENTAIIVPTGFKNLHREGGGIRSGGPAAPPPPLAQPPASPLAGAAAKPSLAALLQARAASNSTVKPFNWRTKICSRWEQAGYCPYETHCIFAHGEAELQRYGGGPVDSEANPSNQGFKVPSSAAASGSSVALGVAASGSSVTHADGSGQPSAAARRPWRGPNKISRVYGDWIDDE